jgi:lysophospholipase L1-like esterase
MVRLPTPGGDNNQWGDILNEYLAQAHNSDGTLKKSAVEATTPSASSISFTPSGDISATNAQAAVIQASSNLTSHVDKLHKPYVVVPASWGSQWKQARTEAASRRVNVHIWSDSIGTTGSGASNPRTTSMAGLIQSNLQTAYGNGGSGYLSHEYATKSGWTNTTDTLPDPNQIDNVGFGGTFVIATSAATMSFTDIQGTTVKIFYRNTQSGSFRWRIDGGSFTTVNQLGVAFEPGVVTLNSLSDTAHSIDIEWISGTAGIFGVYGERATGIVLSRIGQSGRAASDYAQMLLQRITIGVTNGSPTITSAGIGFFNSSMVGRFLSGFFAPLPHNAQITAVSSATSATMSGNASSTGQIEANLSVNRPSWANVPGDTITDNGLPRADLVIVMLGANDPANYSRSPASWMNGVSRILKPYYSGASKDFSPDLILMIEHQGDWFDVESHWPEYTAAMASMAEGMGGALVDVFGIGHRSYKYWNDRGYFADTIHPSDLGHAAYAQPVIDLLNSA